MSKVYAKAEIIYRSVSIRNPYPLGFLICDGPYHGIAFCCDTTLHAMGKELGDIVNVSFVPDDQFAHLVKPRVSDETFARMAKIVKAIEVDVNAKLATLGRCPACGIPTERDHLGTELLCDPCAREGTPEYDGHHMEGFDE